MIDKETYERMKSFFSVTSTNTTPVLKGVSFQAAVVRGEVPVGDGEGERLGCAARKAAAARGVWAVG